MKKYVFDDTTIHTLHAMSKKLYDVFSTADKTIAQSDFEWSHKNEVDYSVNPEKYHDFRMANFQVFIHHLKNGLYTLECYGFQPEGLKPYDVNKFNIEFYRNAYGRFHDFYEAKIAFADVVTDLLRIRVQPLF